MPKIHQARPTRRVWGPASALAIVMLSPLEFVEGNRTGRGLRRLHRASLKDRHTRQGRLRTRIVCGAL